MGEEKWRYILGPRRLPEFGREHVIRLVPSQIPRDDVDNCIDS